MKHRLPLLGFFFFTVLHSLRFFLKKIIIDFCGVSNQLLFLLRSLCFVCSLSSLSSVKCVHICMCVHICTCVCVIVFNTAIEKNVTSLWHYL